MKAVLRGQHEICLVPESYFEERGLQTMLDRTYYLSDCPIMRPGEEIEVEYCFRATGDEKKNESG